MLSIENYYDGGKVLHTSHSSFSSQLSLSHLSSILSLHSFLSLMSFFSQSSLFYSFTPHFFSYTSLLYFSTSIPCVPLSVYLQELLKLWWYITLTVYPILLYLNSDSDSVSIRTILPIQFKELQG